MNAKILLCVGIVLVVGIIGYFSYTRHTERNADALAGSGGITCPALHNGKTLISVGVYDGPSSERADLAPDNVDQGNGTTSIWNIPAPAVSSKGYFLGCSYSDGATSTGQPITIDIPLPGHLFTCTGRNDQNILCSVAHSASESKTPAVPVSPILGDYAAVQGSGEIHVTAKDTSDVLITGQAILAGLGNTDTNEEIEARTGRINQVVRVEDGKAMLYPDPSDKTCMLTLTFTEKALAVSNGYATCDATIANFDGMYRLETTR